MPTIESVNPASMEEENYFSENFENGEIHDDVSASSDDDDDDDDDDDIVDCVDFTTNFTSSSSSWFLSLSIVFWLCCS